MRKEAGKNLGRDGRDHAVRKPPGSQPDQRPHVRATVGDRLGRGRRRTASRTTARPAWPVPVQPRARRPSTGSKRPPDIAIAVTITVSGKGPPEAAAEIGEPGLSSSSRPGITGSSVMPHFGQVPGPIWRDFPDASGRCIGAGRRCALWRSLILLRRRYFPDRFELAPALGPVESVPRASPGSWGVGLHGHAHRILIRAGRCMIVLMDVGGMTALRMFVGRCFSPTIVAIDTDLASLSAHECRDGRRRPGSGWGRVRIAELPVMGAHTHGPPPTKGDIGVMAGSGTQEHGAAPRPSPEVGPMACGYSAVRRAPFLRRIGHQPGRGLRDLPALRPRTLEIAPAH